MHTRRFFQNTAVAVLLCIQAAFAGAAGAQGATKSQASDHSMTLWYTLGYVSVAPLLNPSSVS